MNYYCLGIEKDPYFFFHVTPLWQRIANSRYTLSIDNGDCINLPGCDRGDSMCARIWERQRDRHGQTQRDRERERKRAARKDRDRGSVTRVSRTWCSDMRLPWERRTVVTCGDRIAAWETPNMYLRPRVDMGARSCAPMINRNRQKPKLRDADVAVRGNIADKFSFEYDSPAFFFSRENLFFLSPLSPPFSRPLITLFRLHPCRSWRTLALINDWRADAWKN